jgi:signal transduction histidine kinase
MSEMEQTQTSMYDSLRVFILVFSIIPFLVFEQKRWVYLVLGILPSFVSIAFFDVIMDLSHLGFSKMLNYSNDYQLMQMRTIMAYFVLGTGCFVFQSIIKRNDEYNLKILKELQEKSDEIESQNEELLQSQESLNNLNQHLEEIVKAKTGDLENKNEAIIKYAHANAHAVRGPVARLLGLIQLSKMENNFRASLYFDKIEAETYQIDKIIREISSELNKLDDTDE